MTTPRSRSASKLRLAQEAVRLWATLEDCTKHYVTTDHMRWPRNRRNWDQVAPRLRKIAGSIGNDLDQIHPFATSYMIQFLSMGPQAYLPSTAAMYTVVHGFLIRLESRLRDRKESETLEERRKALEYLARRDAAPDGMPDNDEVAKELGIDRRRAANILRQLSHDGLIDIGETAGDHVSAVINAEGYRFLEEGGVAPQPAIQIGAINFGQIVGSQAGQAGANNQIVIGGGTELSAQIQPLLDQLTQLVESSGADADAREDAASDIAQVTTEVRKHKPNANRILALIADLAITSEALAIAANAHGLLDQIRQIIQMLPH